MMRPDYIEELRRRSKKEPSRATMVALGVSFIFACFSCKRLDELMIFLSIGVFNLAVGAFTAERIANVVITIEIITLFAFLGYTIFHR